MKFLTITLSLVLGLAGCTAIESTSQPSMNSLIFKNLTTTDLRDVEIRVQKLSGIFTCNIILANSFCSNGFPRRVYEGNEITIRWTINETPHVVGPIVVTPPTFHHRNDLTAIIELHDQGQYNAYFSSNNKP